MHKLIFIGLIIFYSLCNAVHSQIPTVNFILLQVDAQTYTMKKYYRFYQPMRKAIPEWYQEVVDFQFIDYDEPSDFGSINIICSLTSKIVYQAPLVWQRIAYPDFPPDSIAQTSFNLSSRIRDPDYFSYWPAIDEYAQQAKDAFAAIEHLDVVIKTYKGNPYAVFLIKLDYMNWWILIHDLPVAPRDVSVRLLWPQKRITLNIPIVTEAFVYNHSSIPEDFTLQLKIQQQNKEIFYTKEQVSVLAPDSSQLIQFEPWTPKISDSLYFEISLDSHSGNQDWVDVYGDNDFSRTRVSTTKYPVFKAISSFQEPGWVPLRSQPLDFDGDNDVDFLTFGSKPKLLENVGENKLIDVTKKYGIAPTKSNLRMAIAEDFTGDGLKELILIYYNSIQYKENTGNNSYVDKTQSIGFADIIPRGYGVALDIENDGDLDLIFKSTGNVTFLENDGYGNFQTVDTGIRDQARTQRITAGDINHDGFVDLFFVNWQSMHDLFINNGDGTFRKFDFNWGSTFGRKAIFIDFNNDNQTDILLANKVFGNSSLLFENIGNLKFIEVSQQLGVNVNSFTADAHDFDKDGDIDILLDDGIFINESGERFVNEKALFNIWEEIPTIKAMGFSFVDLDQDNDMDIYSEYLVMENMGIPLITQIKENSKPILNSYQLFQNYPNPFSREGILNPNTTIRFEIPKQKHIKIEIFNILGQSIATLTNRIWPAGNHELVWDGNSDNGFPTAAGVYIFRLSTPDYVLSRRLVLF